MSERVYGVKSLPKQTYRATPSHDSLVNKRAVKVAAKVTKLQPILFFRANKLQSVFIFNIHIPPVRKKSAKVNIKVAAVRNDVKQNQRVKKCVGFTLSTLTAGSSFQ